MATATSLPLQSSFFALPSNRYLNHQICVSLTSPSSSSSCLRSYYPTAFLKKSTHHFQFLLRASSEGIPTELVEDSKFVPLNSDDPVYGPPALLLIGFEAQETAQIQNVLKELDGEFLKVINCTEDMVTKSAWDAMHTEQPNLETVQIAKSLPRICLLSGLSGEEMMMFIDAFPETGLKPAAFAALVPNSANKLLGEVIEEIRGDHEMLTAKQSS